MAKAKNPKKKVKSSKRTPYQNLADTLISSEIKFDHIDIDKFDDKSGAWIETDIKGHTISFIFNDERTVLKSISLHKDIVEVVNVEQLFTTRKDPVA